MSTPTDPLDDPNTGEFSEYGRGRGSAVGLVVLALGLALLAAIGWGLWYIACLWGR